MKIQYHLAVFLRDQVRNFSILHRCLTDFVYAENARIYPPVLSVSESINTIIRDKASIGRYGDGEYSMCLGKHLKFQCNNKLFTARLCSILYADTPNFHAAILDLKSENNDFYRNNSVRCHRIINKLDNRTRLNVFISTVNNQQNIKAVQRIWEKREIEFITNLETKQTTDELLLFNSAASQQFIAAPAPKHSKNTI